MSNKRLSNSGGSCHRVAFEEIDHTADRALRIFGSNLGDLFLNAAQGMNSLMVAAPTSGPEHREKFVSLEAIDTETLLVDWLSELAYWAEIEMLIFEKFKIESISSTHIRVRLYGTRVKKFKKHIKAVTYHDLHIVQTNKGMTATVVFDV